MLQGLFRCVLCLCLLFITGCGERIELHRQLSEPQANEVMAALADTQIPAQKIPTKNGVSIHVNAQDISRAVHALTAAGLPRTPRSSLGDIFRKEGLISTPLEERARYIYALSQELEATLSKIDGVIIARVHVVLPERVAPGEPVQPASASVFIKHDTRLDPDSVQPRVRRMVAGSLPGMASALDDPQKITMVFVTSSAYKDARQLAYFGPFLVPVQNLDAWKKTFIGSLLGLPLILTGLFFGLKKLMSLRDRRVAKTGRHTS